MVLNGWYKNNTIRGVPSLYQYVNDALQINISLVEKTGLYSGTRLVDGVWVQYTNQSDMNTIWLARYPGANPLPGGIMV